MSGCSRRGYNEVCTYLKGVNGSSGLYQVTENDKSRRRCCIELGGSGQQSGGWRTRHNFTLVYFSIFHKR